MQGWEEFVDVFFSHLYSVAAFLGLDGLGSCLFHVVNPAGQALPLRREACSCPAAGIVAKGNSERDQ